MVHLLPQVLLRFQIKIMDWAEALAGVKTSPQFQTLWENVKDEYKTNTIFPPKKLIFRAIELTPFDEVKVVILGQDPYHGPGQANGLSFSVNSNVAAPPSLRNIFAELENDLGIVRRDNDLQDWAAQGVLLLNAGLTVRAHSANSHQNLGWEFFTDQIISSLSTHREHLVFVLWGSFAQKKAALIDATKHFILKSPHPSPLSAHRGFFGSKPFSKINEYLDRTKQTPIKWG